MLLRLAFGNGVLSASRHAGRHDERPQPPAQQRQASQEEAQATSLKGRQGPSKSPSTFSQAMNPDTFSQAMNTVNTKPPLGLTPRWVLDIQRTREILAAMDRYVEAGRFIPEEWTDELNELICRKRLSLHSNVTPHITEP